MVANNGDNFRLNPDTGAVAGADTALNPGTPAVDAAAYTNQFAGTTSTTLYDIDGSTAPPQLVIQGGNPVPPGASPNLGTLTAVGSLGFNITTGAIGFDIAGPSLSNTAYATLEVGGIDGLYTVNLTTTAPATFVDNIQTTIRLQASPWLPCISPCLRRLQPQPGRHSALPSRLSTVRRHRRRPRRHSALHQH